MFSELSTALLAILDAEIKARRSSAEPSPTDKEAVGISEAEGKGETIVDYEMVIVIVIAGMLGLSAGALLVDDYLKRKKSIMEMKRWVNRDGRKWQE